MSDYYDDLYDVGALSIGADHRSTSSGGRSVATRGRARATPRPRASTAFAPPALMNRYAGVPSMGLRLQPLGFSAVVFGLATGALLATTSRPQRPFQGKRLVVDISRNGTTATGSVTIGQLLIGSNNQMVSSNPIGAAVFAPGSYDTNLELEAASVGIDITVQFSCTPTPTGTDTIIVQATILGEALG